MEFQPQFAIGNVVYHGSAVSGHTELDCPDCLGSGKWYITSPAGESFEQNCPRCDGEKTLKQFSYTTDVRQLTIGSVQMNTEDEPIFSYMCKETGIGGGSVYRESSLFYNAEDAERYAQFKAIEANEWLDNDKEQGPQRQYQRLLHTYALGNAKIREAEDRRYVAERKYRSLLEQILELSDVSVAAPPEGGELRSAVVDKHDIDIIKDSLVKFDKAAKQELIEWRCENE